MFCLGLSPYILLQIDKFTVNFWTIFFRVLWCFMLPLNCLFYEIFSGKNVCWKKPKKVLRIRWKILVHQTQIFSVLLNKTNSNLLFQTNFMVLRANISCDVLVNDPFFDLNSNLIFPFCLRESIKICFYDCEKFEFWKSDDVRIKRNSELCKIFQCLVLNEKVSFYLIHFISRNSDYSKLLFER